jgi:Fic family protein
MRETGERSKQVLGELGYECFIPHALPPEPPLAIGHLEELNDRAQRAMGGLNRVTKFLPDRLLFLYSYVRKEALLSSQIEGTQSSLTDLLLFENDAIPGVPMDDVREVSSYVASMEFGVAQVAKGNPISLGLIKHAHHVLLSSGRGHTRAPGEFRKNQVHIGSSTSITHALFVPPPANEIDRLMSDLEKFINDVPQRTKPLIKAALAHVQFETIHPFLDGNGRIGRLLITLLLIREKVLSDPILYLSLYFKQNREQYYELLQRVRTHGDWESWVEFFLKGVCEVAESAADAADRLHHLFEKDRSEISEARRVSAPMLRMHELLKHKMVVSSTLAMKELNLTRPTALKALGNLRDRGIVREITGKERYSLFAYQKYIDILNEGTEPL